jgi:hypothetical protein
LAVAEGVVTSAKVAPVVSGVAALVATVDSGANRVVLAAALAGLAAVAVGLEALAVPAALAECAGEVAFKGTRLTTWAARCSTRRHIR